MDVLRIQAAIQNRSQADLIIDILESAIDPKLYELIDNAPNVGSVAASETAPKGKVK